MNSRMLFPFCMEKSHKTHISHNIDIKEASFTFCKAIPTQDKAKI